MSRRISLRAAAAPKPLLTFLSSRKGMLSSLEAHFDEAHQAIEREADDADGKDAENDVFVDERVVFLPEETADAGRAGEHFGGDDDEPGDAQAQAEAGEHVWERGGDEDFEEGFGARKFQDFGDVEKILRNGADADGGVKDGRPHCANRDGEERG